MIETLLFVAPSAIALLLLFLDLFAYPELLTAFTSIFLFPMLVAGPTLFFLYFKAVDRAGEGLSSGYLPAIPLVMLLWGVVGVLSSGLICFFAEQADRAAFAAWLMPRMFVAGAGLGLIIAVIRILTNPPGAIPNPTTRGDDFYR